MSRSIGRRQRGRRRGEGNDDIKHQEQQSKAIKAMSDTRGNAL
jgi:hypothetical protein